MAVHEVGTTRSSCQLIAAPGAHLFAQGVPQLSLHPAAAAAAKGPCTFVALEVSLASVVQGPMAGLHGQHFTAGAFPGPKLDTRKTRCTTDFVVRLDRSLQSQPISDSCSRALAVSLGVKQQAGLMIRRACLFILQQHHFRCADVVNVVQGWDCIAFCTTMWYSSLQAADVPPSMALSRATTPCGGSVACRADSHPADAVLPAGAAKLLM